MSELYEAEQIIIDSLYTLIQVCKFKIRASRCEIDSCGMTHWIFTYFAGSEQEKQQLFELGKIDPYYYDVYPRECSLEISLPKHILNLNTDNIDFDYINQKLNIEVFPTMPAPT